MLEQYVEYGQNACLLMINLGKFKKLVYNINQQGRLLSSNLENKEVEQLNNKEIVPLIKRRFDLFNPATLFFLGGFIEGEGSNSVSVSIGSEFKFGVNIQPIFNVTQHENGLEILRAYKELFGRGTIAKNRVRHMFEYILLKVIKT
jgi:hypothetical protein